MDLQHYYLELSPNPIRFDTVSALTNVFFDDSKQQVFAVRSGGATGILVKSANDSSSFIFCMEPREQEIIRSIKFSPDNQILAVQRKETNVDFIPFLRNRPNLNNTLVYKGKSSIVFGFVWINENQVAIISNNGAEIIQIIQEKKQLKSLKSTNMTINWFSWCPTSNWGLLSSNEGTILTPVVFKPGIITKLPRLELGTGQGCSGRDITLGQIYGTNAIMLLKQAATNRCFEVIIYMLNGLGMVPKKTHILRLGKTGRFAINVLDDMIIVHHQATATSMIFDIALEGEVDPSTGIISHAPILPARAIKPFTLELPSIEFDGKTMNCKLYSQDWVLFQPNIVIDGSVGCLWFVNLKLDVLCQLIVDKVRLTEVLLHRSDGKSVILNVLKEMMTTDYNGTSLTIIENVFDKLNHLYKLSIDAEVQSQMGNASSASKNQTKTINSSARVLIDQADMYSAVFSTMIDLPQLGNILLLYLQSLLKHGIQIHNYDLSKMIILDLVKNSKFETLHQLLKSACLNETKPLACFLLSLSNVHTSISQMALDMLARLNSNEIIIEVLLEKGQVIDALRLAATNSSDGLPARKYLEAASRTNDPLIFHSVFRFFQLRNMRQRGCLDFLRYEQCGEYVQHYQYLKDIDAL